MINTDKILRAIVLVFAVLTIGGWILVINPEWYEVSQLYPMAALVIMVLASLILKLRNKVAS